MNKKGNRMYHAKDILIAYITTVNPDSYTIDGQIEKSVIALKRESYGSNTRLVPIDDYSIYYSIDKIVPVASKRKKMSAFITSSEIDQIVKKEKVNQDNYVKNEIDLFGSKQENNIKPRVDQIENELDINKVKRLVA